MPGKTSLAVSLASLPESERRKALSGLSAKAKAAALFDWRRWWARPAQLPPDGDWLVWVIKAGRGFGKTRPGSEWVREMAHDHPGCRIALGGKMPDDYRATMVEGDSGILAVSPPWFKPMFKPSHSPPMLLWPNGSQAFCYSGETPDALRGPAHHFAWIDELVKFKFPQAFWDQLMFGLRLGERPRCVVTTTPRPIPLLKALLADKTTVVTGGPTYDNINNLAPSFISQILRKYEGTRLGRQEIHAEMLEDVPGALWTLARLERNRVREAPALVRVVVAVDPAGSSDEGAAETGIVAAGLGADGHGYVLGDFSNHYTPGEWGAKAVEHYGLLKADRIVGEKNNGGEMVGHTVRMAARDAGAEVAYKAVTASRGKHTRAEPIAALDEQGRVHVVGSLPELEDQLTTWVPGMDSPDRLDAMVWALTELMLGPGGELVLLGAAPGGRTEGERREEEAEAKERAADEIREAIRTAGAYFPGGR